MVVTNHPHKKGVSKIMQNCPKCGSLTLTDECEWCGSIEKLNINKPKCRKCNDTGNIWTGFSGCETYKCDCKLKGIEQQEKEKQP